MEHHNIWSTIPLSEERVLEVSLAVAPQLCNSAAGCSTPFRGASGEASLFRSLLAGSRNWFTERFQIVLDVLQIASQHREGYEYVWFTNPLPLASIPSVSHAYAEQPLVCLCRINALRYMCSVVNHTRQLQATSMVLLVLELSDMVSLSGSVAGMAVWAFNCRCCCGSCTKGIHTQGGSGEVLLQVWHSHIISRPLQNGEKGPGVHVGISKGL